MNKEEYLNQLAHRNNYCECTELGELFKKRKTAGGLEAKCEFLKRNADLENPQREDKKFLQDYQREIDNLKIAVHSYHKSLYQHAAKGKIYFELHDTTQERATKILSLENTQRLLKENKPIITIHCTLCGQQIDIAHSID